ncbi:hypothetical protein APHAL10511_003496 [Amanita phalloides]|nr:hypothetical protein APHAL10511_003496 [Amanita phalloides]
MRGLVAYGDDSQSESEEKSPLKDTNDKSLKTFHKISSESRRIPKSQVIVKRSTTSLKNHTRAHISDDIVQEDSPVPNPESPVPQPQSSGSSSSPMDLGSPNSHGDAPKKYADEISRIRELLKPPPIPGIKDWGIPPVTQQPCDPAIVMKLNHFQELKRNPEKPKHFNDSLMSNRSFRNPHLYAKLVEFVDIDERTTNFPRDVWDPNDVRDEWFADNIAEQQRKRSEQQSAAQSSSKRSHIDFTPSSAPNLSANKWSQAKETGNPYYAQRHANVGSRPRQRFHPYPLGEAVSSTYLREKTKWG